jgi:hypothetical protein
VFGSLKNYISGRASADKQQAPSASTSTQRPAEITREASALASRLQTMHPASPNDDHPGKFVFILEAILAKLILFIYHSIENKRVDRREALFWLSGFPRDQQNFRQQFR